MGLRGFYRSTDTEIRGANGSLFIFAGLRNNVDQIKSMEAIDYCWVEEAQTVSQASLNILIPTIRKPGSELWFSWNPRHQKDPVDAMFRGQYPPPDSIVRYVGPEHNPWLPDVLRAEMEWDKQRDIDKYNHIWRGGYLLRSEARVFKNWRIGTYDEFVTTPQTRFYFGGDWGFSTDPSVLIRSFIEGRHLFMDYEAYAIGCDLDYTPFLFGGTSDLELRQLNEEAWKSSGMRKWKEQWEKDHFNGVPESRKWPIIADSARPETISYMQRHGFPRLRAAVKGPGSVDDGIEFLKSYDIVIHPRCRHAIDEFTLFSWKVDPQTGEILPVLEDKKNNVIDASRYAVEGLRRQGQSLKDGGMVGQPRSAPLQPMPSPATKRF